MAPVLTALRARGEEVEAELALTGQHTELVDQVLEAFDMRPDHDLGIMREGQSLYDVAAGCLDGVRSVVQAFRPDMVLVQGDTATVFFGALVAFFEKVGVGHVEAGLRSGRKWSPFPEEMLRRLTDQLSDLWFAPTPRARANLLAEGLSEEHVHVTGNTVVDALLSIAGSESPLVSPDLERVIGSGRRLVLVTAHRRESFGQPLREILGAIRELADAHPDIDVLYPVHPNPNVLGPARELLGGHPRILLTEPLGYVDLVRAMKAAELILTDSGGIQEEAPTFGTPVLVLRDVTERPEGLEAGVAELVGTDRRRIVERGTHWLATGRRGEPPANPYGDGRAGERIADIVLASVRGSLRRTEDWALR